MGTWIRKARVEEAPLQKDLMLFDPESAKFYVLNATMAFVWRQCDGRRSIEEIAQGLEEGFTGVARDRAADDIKNAIRELEQLGLLSPETEMSAR
jgi:hypothetical protein